MCIRDRQKLLTKTRTGAKVTKTYDEAATPYTRLTRDHPAMLTDQDAATLTRKLTTLNPAHLRREIHIIQATLLEIGRRRGTTPQRAKTNPTYLNKTKMGTRTKRAS